MENALNMEGEEQKLSCPGKENVLWFPRLVPSALLWSPS